MRTGQRGRGMQSPEEAQRILNETGADITGLAYNRHDILGDPETVRKQMLEAAERYQTNSLIVATNVYYFEDRLRSFELVAKALGITPRAEATAG
jgi:alkanesulfonate monooxygenase SsuD/methylene tetrahydromethanopterin reductase-like flavin-dependent oxidoreductase (luciferase family)